MSNCANIINRLTREVCNLQIGFVCFTSTLPVCVEKVDVSVLETLDSATVVKILQECSSTTCHGTITLEEYNLLLAFLYPYGVRAIGINQAACFYKTAMRLNKPHNDSAEPNEPNEPNEPSEPSDVQIELNVRHVEDSVQSSVSNITLTNEAIEAKLKALLEATETESTS